MDRYFPQRKILEGSSHGSSRIATNEPDKPQISTHVLSHLVVLTTSPSSYSQATISGTETRHSTWSRRVGGTDKKPIIVTTQRNETFFKVAPTSPQPLTQHREISRGGTRTIGGGTSPDALRRARRNAARRP